MERGLLQGQPSLSFWVSAHVALVRHFCIICKGKAFYWVKLLSSPQEGHSQEHASTRSLGSLVPGHGGTGSEGGRPPAEVFLNPW